MRTTPLVHWESHAKTFDATVRTATESIIKSPLSAAAYDVSTRFGGLGIRRLIDHALLPSRLAITRVSHNAEKLGRMSRGFRKMPCLNVGVDRKTLDRLMEKANTREKQRLRRLDCKHPNAWTALPSATDGRDTIGDVSFANWRYGRGLAIDVAVICPLADSHVHQEEPCEVYAERQKHKRYDAGFVGSNYDFVAMVFETSGAVNSEGK